jgi:hypothetical protein
MTEKSLGFPAIREIPVAPSQGKIAKNRRFTGFPRLFLVKPVYFAFIKILRLKAARTALKTVFPVGESRPRGA